MLGSEAPTPYLEIVKEFRTPADNQERILDVFQEEGWPPHIDDPLPPKPGKKAKECLKTAVRRLNANQQKGRIRFRRDGRGLGIMWEPG